MVRALVAGRGTSEVVAALRQAGFDFWSLEPPVSGAGSVRSGISAGEAVVALPSLVGVGGDALLVLLVEADVNCVGVAEARPTPPTPRSYADLVPSAPFTEWRSLVFSLWPGGIGG